MKTIVTEIGAGIAYYAELHNWVKGFDIDPNDENFEPLSLMEGDPDILRCNGRKLYFMDVELDGTKFILTSDETNEQEKKMLTEFHQENFKEHCSEGGCWVDFEQTLNAVAYRGGKGYVYTIWNYTPKTEL